MGKLSIFFVLLFLFSCRSESKVECNDANTIKILPHAMDFFFFKTGSWWVYEEENTKERDSIWVALNEVTTSNGPSAKYECQCGFGKCVQTAYLTFYNKEFNEIEGRAYIYSKINSSFREGEYDILEGGMSVNNGYIDRMTYKHNMYVTEKYPNGIYEDLPFIEVKGKKYSDILHLYYDIAKSPNIQDWMHEAWYAKNIYLVKFRKSDSTTWNLVKYNIVK